MAGLIKEVPRESAGDFKAVWTGNPQFDLASAMEWSAKDYHLYSRFFADPVEPRYRIFLRANPYNLSNGTATIHAFAMGYCERTTAHKMEMILGHEMTISEPPTTSANGNTEGDAVCYQARLPWRTVEDRSNRGE